MKPTFSPASLFVIWSGILAALAPATLAEEITIYNVNHGDPIRGHYTMIGASPVAVDKDGRTFYVASYLGAEETKWEQLTETFTFRADASRILQHRPPATTDDPRYGGYPPAEMYEDCKRIDKYTKNPDPGVMHCVLKYVGVPAPLSMPGQASPSPTDMWATQQAPAGPWVTVTVPEGLVLPTQDVLNEWAGMTHDRDSSAGSAARRGWEGIVPALLISSVTHFLGLLGM